MSEKQFILDIAVNRMRAAEEKIEKENKTWKEYNQKESELYAKLNEILPEEYQKDFQDYCEATYCGWCEKTSDIYKEGVKDGIRLMKSINEL